MIASCHLKNATSPGVPVVRCNTTPPRLNEKSGRALVLRVFRPSTNPFKKKQMEIYIVLCAH